MLKIIMYDIDGDKPRTKLAKYLEREGFIRLQYSVFAGDIKAHHWKKVWGRLKLFFEEKCQPHDKIYVTKIDADNFRKMEGLGEKPDIPYILNEQNSLYL